MSGRLLTLKEACIHLAGDKITPATLRAEAARGKLAIVRLGRRDFVTVEALDAMVSACHVEPKAPASTSIRRASNGSSETDQKRVRIVRAAMDWVYNQNCSNALMELEEAVTDFVGFPIGEKAKHDRYE